MSTRVILSLCVAACVAGCAFPRLAPRDGASAAQSEQESQEAREKFKSILLLAAAAEAEHEVTELKPQLALTSEQEAAFREAYTQEFRRILDQVTATLASLSTETRKPAPPGEAAPFRVHSQRELWEPILTPQQLAAYDAFKARQRKERVAVLATERVNQIDSQLGLNEDQRNRVCEIFMMSEEKGLMAKDDLWPSADTDLENKSLATVLTPEQFKKYQKLTASPNSNTQKQYIGGLFIPPVFSLPHFGNLSSGSFRGR